MTPPASFDVIIVGSGAGGAAAAYRLALAGMNVLLFEKGAALPHDGSTLDDLRVVERGEFLSKEPWIDGTGKPICPQEHFNVGGKTKWYGAAVLRFSPREFEADAARRIAEHAYGFFLQTEDGSHPDNRVVERGQPAVRVMDYEPGRTPASQNEHQAFTRALRRALLRQGFVSFTQRVGLNGSILPRSSRVNPSLSIYAWALRVADRLAKSRGAAAA